MKDGAGKSATWNETFQLPSIKDHISSSLTFKAFDKDTGSSDFLGVTDPVDLVDFLSHEQESAIDL